MIVHDDVGDDHRSATATTGGGRSWSPESSRQESTVHRFVAGPSQFLPDRRVVDFFRILANSSSSRQFHAKPVVDPRRRVAPRRAAPRRADRTPSVHDSDPHTAVPVCPRYGNPDGSGKPDERKSSGVQ